MQAMIILWQVCAGAHSLLLFHVNIELSRGIIHICTSPHDQCANLGVDEVQHTEASENCTLSRLKPHYIEYDHTSMLWQDVNLTFYQCESM